MHTACPDMVAQSWVLIGKGLGMARAAWAPIGKGLGLDTCPGTTWTAMKFDLATKTPLLGRWKHTDPATKTLLLVRWKHTDPAKDHPQQHLQGQEKFPVAVVPREQKHIQAMGHKLNRLGEE